MDFTLSGEQRQFAASLHEMLAAADSVAAARAWAAGSREPGLRIWRSLAGAGVTALAVPARFGGLGAHPVDLVIACEELGHHAVPGPIAETLAAIPVVLAGVAPPDVAVADATAGLSSIRVALAPDKDQFAEPGSGKRPGDDGSSGPGGPEAVRWLRQLASGELLATLAAPPVLPFAADAEVAGLVLLAGRGLAGGALAGGRLAGGPGSTDASPRPAQLWLGEPGPARRSVDATRSLSEVSPVRLLAEGPDVARAAARALDFGALACAAQLLGAGRALLEASARHARQRVQFGQPVGSFQAVKHLLADVLIKLEFARPLLYGAAVALARDAQADPVGPVTAPAGVTAAARDVSAAKVACTDAAYLASRVALQVHGAIGYTAEHDAGLWLTRVQALRFAWGSQAEHRARVLAALTAPSVFRGNGDSG